MDQGQHNQHHAAQATSEEDNNLQKTNHSKSKDVDDVVLPNSQHSREDTDRRAKGQACRSRRRTAASTPGAHPSCSSSRGSIVYEKEESRERRRTRRSKRLARSIDDDFEPSSPGAYSFTSNDRHHHRSKRKDAESTSRDSSSSRSSTRRSPRGSSSRHRNVYGPMSPGAQNRRPSSRKSRLARSKRETLAGKPGAKMAGPNDQRSKRGFSNNAHTSMVAALTSSAPEVTHESVNAEEIVRAVLVDEEQVQLEAEERMKKQLTERQQQLLQSNGDNVIVASSLDVVEEKPYSSRRHFGSFLACCCCVLIIGLAVGVYFGLQSSSETRISIKDTATEDNDGNRTTTLVPTDIVDSFPPSSSPTQEVCAFDPPTPDQCNRIANGTEVKNQDDMGNRSFKVRLDVVIDENYDLAVVALDLQKVLQSFLIPDLAGCGGRNSTTARRRTRGISLGQHRQLDVCPHIVANGVSNVQIPENDDKECDEGIPNCIRASATLDLYLNGPERIDELIEMLTVTLDNGKLSDSWILPPALKEIIHTSVESGDITPAPSRVPTNLPSASPTIQLSQLPSEVPPTTSRPTFLLNTKSTPPPTPGPTPSPTAPPNPDPTPPPTKLPTLEPSPPPTTNPTPPPTRRPTPSPTAPPNPDPTPPPTQQPTKSPTPPPTPEPTPSPTRYPTSDPKPTRTPTTPPTPRPTPSPASPPNPNPTPPPTRQPTKDPTPPPTPDPTPPPTRKVRRETQLLHRLQPTSDPTPPPSPEPSPLPTRRPTRDPTPQPTPLPTPLPTPIPTRNPTPPPSPNPTKPPTQQPVGEESCGPGNGVCECGDRPYCDLRTDTCVSETGFHGSTPYDCPVRVKCISGSDGRKYSEIRSRQDAGECLTVERDEMEFDDCDGDNPLQFWSYDPDTKELRNMEGDDSCMSIHNRNDKLTIGSCEGQNLPWTYNTRTATILPLFGATNRCITEHHHDIKVVECDDDDEDQLMNFAFDECR
eukprot:scaffold609_cov130-Cylindrotheca_fusiformis.AAC.12